MRIERIRIEGFGALAGVDVEWPEGRLLLVVDSNESGKTTFCEAIVTALYGLPRGRVGAARAKELRRPRSGAPLRVIAGQSERLTSVAFSADGAWLVSGSEDSMSREVGETGWGKITKQA